MALTTTASGVKTGDLLYKPWGETRYDNGTTPTTWRFTGQREDATIGLYFYNARYYDPALGRFPQPDTIVPQPGNPGSLNRYSYVLNNPLKYTDPTGHRVSDGCEYEGCDLRNGLPSSSTYFVPRVGYTMYPQTVEPLVSPVVQQAASELLAAIDPRNLPELRYDDAGNIDWDATISTLSMFPALHACALTVQGACAVSIQGSGYMPGMGGRSSFEIWVTTSGEIVPAISVGGGAYVSPNLFGGGSEVGVTVLPGAVINDLDEWNVQVGGSGAFGGGVGGEIVFSKADSGKTIIGWSTSLAFSKAGLEGHASFTHTWINRPYTYIPRNY